MAFPRSFLEELVARNDILDVVGGYVTLQPKCGSYWGGCPFPDATRPPSMSCPTGSTITASAAKKAAA